MQRRFVQLINRSVNNWFHATRPDGSSPAIWIREFSNHFLRSLDRMNFSLICTPEVFRRNLCEALCTMFNASKQNVGWYGPNSDPPRPEGWSDTNEYEWKDLLRSMYFTYSFFENLWDQIGEGQWEKTLPHWRTSIEHIVLHYIALKPEMLETDVPSSFKQEAAAVPNMDTHDVYEDDFW